MTFAVVGGLVFLIAFGLVLFTVYRMRPELFKFKAVLTKWVSLDLEMRSPRQPPDEHEFGASSATPTRRPVGFWGRRPGASVDLG
jgi:hypothetical protein